MSEDKPHISTDCAHAGNEEPPSESTPSVMPIYQTSIYEVVVADDSYGGTLSLAARAFPRFGIAGRPVPMTNLEAVERALSAKTKVLLVETLSNPLGNVIDVGRVAEMCRRKGVKLLVDNTAATPFLICPLTIGELERGLHAT